MVQLKFLYNKLNLGKNTRNCSVKKLKLFLKKFLKLIMLVQKFSPPKRDKILQEIDPKESLGLSLWDVQYVLLFLNVLVSSGGTESIRLRVRRLFNDSSFNWTGDE